MNNKPFLRFRASLTATLALAVLVVLAGATVRATGAGMGCPDWPLCYGLVVPPTSVDQLPADYSQRYAVTGRAAEFDAVKTWIEYVNRLLGALTGASMLLTAVLASWVVRQRPALGWLVLSSVLVLGFVAWLGARVVGSFLEPYAVTLHLLAAYLLLGLLLAAREVTSRVIDGPRVPVSPGAGIMLFVVGLAFFMQWTLGIRTREEVEALIWDHTLADSIWEAIGGAYHWHKVTGFIVAGAVAVLAARGWQKRAADRRFAALTLVCGALVIVQGALGLTLWWGGLPDWVKPLHLLTATAAWSCWAASVFHALPGRRLA